MAGAGVPASVAPWGLRGLRSPVRPLQRLHPLEMCGKGKTAGAWRRWRWQVLTQLLLSHEASWALRVGRITPKSRGSLTQALSGNGSQAHEGDHGGLNLAGTGAVPGSPLGASSTVPSRMRPAGLRLTRSWQESPWGPLPVP